MTVDAEYSCFVQHTPQTFTFSAIACQNSRLFKIALLCSFLVISMIIWFHFFSVFVFGPEYGTAPAHRSFHVFLCCSFSRQKNYFLKLFCHINQRAHFHSVLDLSTFAHPFSFWNKKVTFENRSKPGIHLIEIGPPKNIFLFFQWGFHDGYFPFPANNFSLHIQSSVPPKLLFPRLKWRIFHAKRCLKDRYFPHMHPRYPLITFPRPERIFWSSLWRCSFANNLLQFPLSVIRLNQCSISCETLSVSFPRPESCDLSLARSLLYLFSFIHSSIFLPKYHGWFFIPGILNPVLFVTEHLKNEILGFLRDFPLLGKNNCFRYLKCKRWSFFLH